MKKQLLVGRNLFFSAFFALSGSCWAAYAQSGTPTVSETYIELTTKNANDPLEITVKGASYADACWIDLNGNNTYDGASEDAPRFYKRLEKSIASVRIYGNVGELSANRTNIVKIDLTHNPATLKEVSIKENKELAELDLSKSAQLKSLEVDGCEALTQLSFPEGAKLTLLSCGKSGIKELDLKNLKDLEALMCGELGLTTLDVSMLEKLTNLSCFGNKLAKLDISNNKKLFSLKCDNCEMEELVLGDVSSLKSFSANNNKLKTIDVSKLTQISKISLQDNLLESIVVAKEMSRLEDCRIYNNKLSARAMMSFIEQLPKKEYDNGSLFVINTKVADKNVCTKDAVAKA
ncbi:MAG: leucine-rich repeat domain-containing protein, partial [Porphyromonas endodontalis]